MKRNRKDNKLVNRREFLGVAWVLSLIGLFVQAGAALYQFFRPRVEVGGFGGEVVAGNLEEFAPGSVNQVQKGRFFISRLEDGGVLVMWHRCTHLGCTVPWREDEALFYCPCHSSLFNRQGEVLGGPAPRPLDLFAVTLNEGKLVVDTSQPIVRQQFDESQVFYPG